MRPPTNRDLIRIEGSERIFDRRRILLVLLIPLSMSLMAVSSTNVALPSIQIGISASEADLQWVLSGYALVYGITLVPSGRAGDVLGRGRFFIIGISLFTLASLICGLALTPPVLLAARVAQGIGAGILSPQITGMITQYFSGQGRAKAFALFGVVVSASVAVGPLLAGGIIEAFGPAIGWRASFIVNVLFGVAAIVLALAWFPFDTERRRRAARLAGEALDRHIDLDPVGAALLAGGVLTIMLPFVLKRPSAFALLALGAALIWVWVRWEAAYKARGHAPMVDLALFRHRSFSAATAISTIQFLASPSIFVIIALYLQRDLGTSAFITGMVGLPNAIASGLLAMVAGRYALSRGRSLQIVGLSTIIAGIVMATLVVAAFDQRVSIIAISAALALMGVGQGIMGSVNQTLSLAEVPPSAGGTAGGVKQTGERVATGIGQAIFTAIFFGVAAHDWSTGLVRAYLAITAVISIALVVAIIDRRTQGPGVPESSRT